MNDQPTKAGLYASAAMHAALLAFLVFGFSFAPKFEDAGELIPVETVSQSQFNQIMKGERDAKPMKEPPPEPPQRQAAADPQPVPAPARLRLRRRPTSEPVRHSASAAGRTGADGPPRRRRPRRRPSRPPRKRRRRRRQFGRRRRRRPSRRSIRSPRSSRRTRTSWRSRPSRRSTAMRSPS